MVETLELVVVFSVIWLPLLWFIGFMLYEAYDAETDEKPDPIPFKSMFGVEDDDDGD